MNVRHFPCKSVLPVVAFFLPTLCVVLAVNSTAAAQSTNDPNRPPYAQNSVRQTSQHSATGGSAAAPANATPRPSADGISPDEQSLLDHANESRVLAGLPALHWDSKLAAAAKRHCAVMVQQEALSHQFPGEPDMQQRVTESGAGYSALAENVALAATADEIHLAWMQSAGHRANLLDPKMTAVGISVMPGNRGLYAVEDFSLEVGSISIEQQEQRVRELLNAAGVRTADSSDHVQLKDARRACLEPDSYAGRPAMVTHFETSDLTKLPDKLQSVVSGGKYHSAAVGACDPSPSGGFTRFRLAVLLYY